MSKHYIKSENAEVICPLCGEGEDVYKENNDYYCDDCDEEFTVNIPTTAGIGRFSPLGRI